MSKTQTKTSAYFKRQLESIPAPLEPDSDSDFNSKPYVYETKKKKSKTRSTKDRNQKTSRGKKRKRSSSDEDEDFVYEIPNIQKATRIQPESAPRNLMQEFFGHNPDLESASDGEDGDDEMQSDEDEDDGSDINEDEPPRILKAIVGLKTNSSQPATTVEKSTSASSENPHKPEDDSVTESDSAVEPNFELPSNQTKKPAIAEDSVTESDSDVPVAPVSRPVPSTTSSKPKPAEPEEDSVTESESEPEQLNAAHPDLSSRPGFPLNNGQVALGPLVLDAEKGIKVPAAINTYLREYQREGIKFFYRQYKQGRGGLLGDDMGLVGKTIQVISFLSAIMRKNGIASDQDRRRKHVSKVQDGEAWKKRRELPASDATWPTCLIIAPSSVVPNWEREFETWGYFEVGIYAGSPKERQPVLNDFKMGRLDVVVTSFEIARKDIDLLDSLAWSCIIVDEVHRVKNKRSKIAKAYHQFNCPRRFGLTGTAIQNSYDELWAILDWTNPHWLGTSKQWSKCVTRPLAAGQSARATEEERAKSLEVAVILKDKLLPQLFLRRTKHIIKDQLPKKVDLVVFCPLADIQRRAYKRILESDAVRHLVHKDDPCECGSKKQTKKCCHPYQAEDLLRYMSVLIKLSNHLALILPGPDDNPEQLERHRALAQVSFPDGRIPKHGAAELAPQYCGKWLTLQQLLTDWRSDTASKNKVLIFTKSVRLLNMLEYYLKRQGHGFITLTGSTKQRERMPLIDKFHADPSIFIFLISTLAGGTGLNLTGANKVVIFDPNWNPAHDLQAMDRAFRLGQKRDVEVYRLLGAGALEELIYARQLYKQQQMAIGYEASIQTRYFEGVQGDKTKQGELFGIKNIFKLHEDKLATKMAIENANLAQLDWALANMGGSGTKKNEDIIRPTDADLKSNDKEDDLQSLGALLFDDNIPQHQAAEQDDVEKTLSAIGISYSHRNDEILLPSKIEMERAKIIVEKTRSRRKKARQSARGSPPQPDLSPPKPQWPPVRKHHKRLPPPPPPPDPEQQLALRHQALIDLGYIKNPQDVSTFAQAFVLRPKNEQEQILVVLDEYAATMQSMENSSD